MFDCKNITSYKNLDHSMQTKPLYINISFWKVVLSCLKRILLVRTAVAKNLWCKYGEDGFITSAMVLTNHWLDVKRKTGGLENLIGSVHTQRWTGTIFTDIMYFIFLFLLYKSDLQKATHNKSIPANFPIHRILEIGVGIKLLVPFKYRIPNVPKLSMDLMYQPRISPSSIQAFQGK